MNSKSRFFSVLCFVLFSLTLTPAGAQVREKPRVDRHHVFVRVKAGEELPASKWIRSAQPLFDRVLLIETPDAAALQRELQGNPAVEYIEANTFHGKRRLPEVQAGAPLFESFGEQFFNDPQVSRIWSFADDSGNGISVNKAYATIPARAQADVIVAVVDTGVDYNHEDLKSVMWVNPREIPGNGIDDDGNGYVDDVHGINTLVRDSQGRATGNPMASHAHGTHVSGTIAAAQNNRIGIAGIASRARIMAIRTVPDDADETDANVVESFLYAARNGARLINCSFGKEVNEGGRVVKEAIDHVAQKYGVLVVAAAGNDSSSFQKWDIDVKPKYPASYDSEGLLVIAATGSSGGLASFSNVGRKSVDVAAPGVNIWSTLPRNSYGSMSGTSMATPTTVGMLAEVLSRYPTLTPLELKQVAMVSVTPVVSFQSYMASGGRVNLYQALLKAASLR